MRRLLLAFLPVVSLIAASNDLRLIDAIKNSDTKSARSLLAQHIDVNAAEADGSTALHWLTRRVT